MEPSNSSLLATEKVGKLMRKYAIPCILSLLVGALYNIVDQIFIANAEYLGSYGNAANTVVFPLTAIALAIAALDGARKGERVNMKVFDNREFEEKREEYAKEAREKWGDTEAYREFEEKHAARSRGEELRTGADMMQIFADFGALPDRDPASDAAQALVQRLRDFITANYYDCTPQILSGLGQMYAAEGEMRDNIDRAGGPGTAVFAAEAVRIYCEQF